ncbi:MAG TPA: hypothetical protein PL152_07475 [Steroidobacteraceae bacterium]|nr:hypothetical protein [Steroidobacteraceae bacterium]
MFLKKHCGTLGQCNLAISGTRKKFAQIRLGDRTLTDVATYSDELADAEYRNRDMCLYLFRVLTTNYLIGWKRRDTGDKLLLPGPIVRNWFLQIAVVYAFVYLFAAFFGALLLLTVLGVKGSTSLGGYAAVAGVLLAWYYAVTMLLAYREAKAD